VNTSSSAHSPDGALGGSAGSSTALMLDAEQLLSLKGRIIESGVLGRSRHYARLFSFLIDCTIAGRSPREIDLATEGLGRGDDYDVGSDSSVRVYIHQLRKKLDIYYEQHEPEATSRITIPKGQYRIAVEALQPEASPAALQQVKGGWDLNSVLLGVVALLLLANLYVMLRPENESRIFEVSQTVSHPVWQSLLADDQPILLVMGDYYIFGELNANGNVARMVREFNVNSSSDLEELRFSDIARAENYLDLDLSYMPESSAFALTKIVPILEASKKPVSITMMSDLTMADVRNNHIVYIGYLSALDKLSDLMFAGSELGLGRSYDELINKRTLEFYTSDAGLPEQGQRFRDYGFFSTFSASAYSHVILISGMRDAGVMHTAQALSNIDSINELVASIADDTDESLANFEALFEVYGVDRMNFDASIVHAATLDKAAVWSRQGTVIYDQ
jgi:hypothetical protein